MSDSRNIDLYQQAYDQSPFEATMVEIRKNVVLDFLTKNNARNIIEVGCGNSSILNDYAELDRIVVVEPSRKFYEKALLDATRCRDKHIVVINDYFSDALIAQNSSFEIDAILISGLLHEVPDPATILKSAYRICGPQTRVHVNVPNAYSLHRILAYELGWIGSVSEISNLQKKLQQYRTFDLAMLIEMVAEAGFAVASQGSYFIKPFTHQQMHALENHELFGKKIIEGFEKLAKYMPDYGSEIFVNLQK